MKRLCATALAVGLAFGACSSGASGRPEILVFAAASLTDSFGDIGRSFERATDVAVTFSFAGSDALARQIVDGASADVFASADLASMDAVAGDLGVTGRRVFACNRLVLLVPSRNDAGITGIGDLARSGVKLVLAAEAVPAGRYARDVLVEAGIAEPALRNLVSSEADVKGVVQKVLLDEADAGIVYVTDVTASIRDRVRAIELPDELKVIASYEIAMIGDVHRTGPAGVFVDFVLGPGRRILRNRGFAPPS